jgi:hypothetical protein
VCYVCKAQEVLDVTVLLSADTSVSFWKALNKKINWNWMYGRQCNIFFEKV